MDKGGCPALIVDYPPILAGFGADSLRHSILPIRNAIAYGLIHNLIFTPSEIICAMQTNLPLHQQRELPDKCQTGRRCTMGDLT